VPIVLICLAVGGSALAAFFAFLAFLRTKRERSQVGGVTREDLAQVVREESDRIRADASEQARGLRQEVADNIRGFQTATLQAFGEFSKQLGDQIKDFGSKLDSGLKAIDDRAGAIGTKLDQQLERMFTDTVRGRETLQAAITVKLDDAGTKSATAARELREEVSGAVHAQQEALVTLLGEQRAVEGTQFEAFAKRLTESLTAIESLLHRSLADMSTTGEARHQTIVQNLDAKSTELTNANSQAAQTLRAELTQSFQHLVASLNETVAQFGTQQKERLEAVTRALGSLAESQSKAQEALRATVESRLDVIRSESAVKLEEMRQTVDEKLQSTLERRLGEAFKIVSDQLERVYQGLGEMQSLAAGVGDLKKVLSNVKVRGTWGEIQLGNLLEQFLSPEQYIRNAQTKEESLERVEFAIRLPGRNDDKEVLLPIDAKFPQEDFERLVAAAENADAVGVEAASAALEARVKACAKTISDKYINPPLTTDIAILFLPTESLYAEVLRRPGLFEHVQREHHITLAGPTTLTAILNALQMGFRSLAIEKRSSEVWRVLGAIRSEFNKYGEVVGRLRRQLNTAVNTIDNLGMRTRAMNRKLHDVELLSDGAAEKLLGLDEAVEIPEPDAEVPKADAEEEENQGAPPPWWKQQS
jgi:DNA recombination protein RmuC